MSGSVSSVHCRFWLRAFSRALLPIVSECRPRPGVASSHYPVSVLSCSMLGMRNENSKLEKNTTKLSHLFATKYRQVVWMIGRYDEDLSK